MNETNYVLGHSEQELQRLTLQADVLEPLTSRLLCAAGIEPGMTVLDVGCGAGDVTMLVAHAVGPAGSVVGIDHDASAIALARERTNTAGLSWARYHQAAMAEIGHAQLFDAVIGRYVLIYQNDPVAFLRTAARHVRPGGVIAFHELNGARACHSLPIVPIWQLVSEWITTAMMSATPSYDAGGRFVEHFFAAGLPQPNVRCEVPLIDGTEAKTLRWVAETVRTLLPVLTGPLGIEADLIGIETLGERLRSAITDARSQVECPPQFLAWARL